YVESHGVPPFAGPAKSIRILGRPISGERWVTPGRKSLNSVGQMNLRNAVVSARYADLVGLRQHVRMRKAVRRFKTIAGELDQKAQWIREIDGIHETPILDAGMLDLALVETFHRLREGGA